MRSAFSSYTAVYFVRLRCENSTPKGIALQKIIILLCLCTADLSAEIESSDLRSNSLKAPPTPSHGIITVTVQYSSLFCRSLGPDPPGRLDSWILILNGFVVQYKYR